MLVEEWKRKNPPIQRKPITNDDRINAMSVEEKAEWFSQFECSVGCKARRDACGYGNNCYKAWLDWLRQETTE